MVKMRKNVFQIILFVIATIFSSISVLGSLHQEYKYYFNITCNAKGEGHYGERWDMTLTVECSCIESSYYYEDITVYILLYETYQGSDELTKTISFFFGDMKPEDSKTLSQTIKTKYTVDSPTDRDNIRLDISDTATFTKKPINNPVFLWYALVVITVVVGGTSIIGFLYFRSRKQADSVYTLGTSPKTQFVSSHKATPPSETNSITILPRSDTIVCSKCGAIVQVAQKFCSRCGSDIKE